MLRAGHNSDASEPKSTNIPFRYRIDQPDRLSLYRRLDPSQARKSKTSQEQSAYSYGDIETAGVKEGRAPKIVRAIVLL